METIKVSSKSEPSKVAGALANALREKNKVEMQAIGAGALNQAIKGIAIARGFVAPTGKNAILEFLTSGLFKGIGEKKAKAIVDTLGENAIIRLLKYLKGNWYIDRLEENGVFDIESPRCFGGNETSDETGVLTSNISQMKYINKKLILYTNLRIPVDTNFDKKDFIFKILNSSLI